LPGDVGSLRSALFLIEPANLNSRECCAKPTRGTPIHTRRVWCPFMLPRLVATRFPCVAWTRP